MPLFNSFQEQAACCTAFRGNVADVYCLRRVDDPETAPEQHRDQMDLNLVECARAESFLRHVRAAQLPVSAANRSFRRHHSAFDSIPHICHQRIHRTRGRWLGMKIGGRMTRPNDPSVRRFDVPQEPHQPSSTRLRTPRQVRMDRALDPRPSICTVAHRPRPSIRQPSSHRQRDIAPRALCLYLCSPVKSMKAATR